MGLHIREPASKQALRAFNGKLLGGVDHMAAAVIALSRITFRIFVGENRAGGFKHGARHVILRRDQLDLIALAHQLPFKNARDLRIGRLEWRRKEIAQGRLRIVR